MESTQADIQKQKNSNLSVAFIVINILLMLALVSIGRINEDQKIFNMAILTLGATILVGAYAFTYKGKQYRVAKWIFGILLLASIIAIVLLAYLIALGHAFKN